MDHNCTPPRECTAISLADIRIDIMSGIQMGRSRRSAIEGWKDCTLIALTCTKLATRVVELIQVLGHQLR
ncbi:hypothetical protein HETIRDRAFT_439599 [Heterobasidion irregulare TC 32-1]|uniref:Uncharacterized protein n=1 Tax=Heterobasidion irregulare (strain TC 32-1) TaxID=747525 RepID=W4KCH9_HETIT|nr:uncharacterized protein HETIRDRAFT_439599 [Heterobasidion irregulare TC 32-1]ETW83045.1 hypothetical protein HETIRDRAFT_439599 [Heterobasidion irregulare TC 32-1]